MKIYMLNCNTKKFILVTVLTTIVFVTLAFSLSIDNSFVTAEATKDPQVPSSSNQGKVFVMYAASLIKTFENSFGPLFQKETGYTYEGEARGSVQVANMIIDGLRRPDVFVSAGTIPIMKLMNSSTSNNGDVGKSSSSTSLAEWLIKFASAEMVIAYSPTSHFYSDLEKARKGEIPWYEVLSKQGFKFGRTDPEPDPKGYYMIITAKLSNMYYNNSTIKQRTLGDDRNPKQIFPEEILKTILEQGQLDAVAAYKHEAVARGLPYITLPSQINLADPTFVDIYRKISYISENSGQTIDGEPIYFSF